VLVGWASEVYDDAHEHVDHRDPSDQPSWVGDARGRKIALTRRPLAPGLSVYSFGTVKGPVTLKDDRGAAHGTFTASAAGKVAMAAPAVRAVTLSSSKEFRGERRHAVAELGAAPPPEAVAVIVYHAGKGKELGAPMTFATLPDTHDKLTSLEVFQDVTRCGGIPDGSTAPTAGATLQLAWVDAFGRLSPLSPIVTAK
jgi:hypothetical protein